jgi:hypothetical protein
MSAIQWVLLLLSSAAAIILVSWFTRRLSLFRQFLVLLAISVCVSFLLMSIVQLPEDRPWLSTLLVVTVFLASPIAVRLFLRGLYAPADEASEDTSGSPGAKSANSPNK